MQHFLLEYCNTSKWKPKKAALVDEFDVDDTDGIEIFEFIAMIKKYQEVFKLSDYEELVKSIKLVVSYVHYHYENNFDLATSWVVHLITHFRRLNTKREGVRYDKIKVSETISAKARVQRQNHLWCIIMNNYSQNAKHASFDSTEIQELIINTL